MKVTEKQQYLNENTGRWTTCTSSVTNYPKNTVKNQFLHLVNQNCFGEHEVSCKISGDKKSAKIVQTIRGVKRYVFLLKE